MSCTYRMSRSWPGAKGPSKQRDESKQHVRGRHGEVRQRAASLRHSTNMRAGVEGAGGDRAWR